jgi:hypothetical protein
MDFNLVPKTTKALNFENGLKYMTRLDGRDKAMRLVQYFSRYLMWQLQQSDPKVCWTHGAPRSMLVEYTDALSIPPACFAIHTTNNMYIYICYLCWNDVTY